MSLPSSVVAKCNGLTIDSECAFSGPQQAHQDIEQGALTATSNTDETNATSSGDGEVKFFKHPRHIRAVAKRELIQCDLLPERQRFSSGLVRVEQVIGVVQPLF